MLFFLFCFKKLAIIQIELFLHFCYNMVFLYFRVALLLIVGFVFFFPPPSQCTLFLLFLVLKLVALLTLPGEQLGSFTCRWDSVCVRVVLEVASPETGVQGVLGPP